MLATAIAAIVAGCASHLPQTPTLIGPGDAGRTVRLHQGDTLVVAMPQAAATGRWKPAVSTDAVLQQVGMADLLPSEVAPGTVGAPNETVYRFRATGVGTTTLAFDAGDAGQPQALRYDVTVVPRPGEYVQAFAPSR